ncbi:MAG: nitroreductase family protein [Bacteroidales bacterium]|nr:nitroreductase family protein [Bacteroidales bacterium]
MLKIILDHRSIRNYKEDPVPDSVLQEILTAATRASTTGNMQVYSIVVTTETPVKEMLWEAHFRQNMVKQAPLVLTFCADFNRFNKWCRLRKADPGYDNFLSFMTAAIDALLASQNCALAAESHGLGICYLGTTTYNADKIIDVLNLPEAVVPVTTLVIGYPAESPELTDRLPVDAVVHHEKYHDYTPRDIDRLYAEKESLELTSQLLEVNQLETLAQIFTRKRYTRKDSVLFSKKYLEVIEKQGFMNNSDEPACR